MTGDDCVNCGSTGAEPQELQIRNTRHREVALCATCHGSIEQELEQPE